MELVTIESRTDWRPKLQELGATVILDPSAIRVAELFVQGRSRAGDESWGVISSNISSLATFVDALVLEPKVPVFDYATTFWRPREEVLGDLGFCSPILIPVRVQPDAYMDIRGEVVAAMRKGASIPAATAAVLRAELDSLGWTYESRLFGDDLSDTKAAGDPSGDKRVNTMLYIQLLFARYAQEFSGRHLVTPNMSRLLLAASLHHPPDRLPDMAYFDSINQSIWRATPTGVDRTLVLERPSFLPNLLDSPLRTPADLLLRALERRNDRLVPAYREWIDGVNADLFNGNINQKKRKDIQRVANKLARQLAPPKDPENISAEFKAQIDGKGPSLSLGFQKEFNAAPFRDWLIALAPGKRYQKLLLKLAMSQAQHVAVELQLRRLWASA
jgi:hypothetical protein